MRKRFLIDLNLAICIILAVFIVFLFAYKLDGGNLNAKNDQFSDGWTYEDGTTVDFSDLRYAPDGCSITKTVAPEQVSGADLCFESRSLFFTVYVNDQAVYDFHPELLRIYGNYYGECIHTVDIPALDENSEIRITYQSLFEANTTTFYFMKIQEGASFIRTKIADNSVYYLQCFVIMILGAVLIVVGFLLKNDTNSLIETVSLGTTALLLAIWTSSGSRIPQIITENPAMVRVMDYICLIFLPVPVIILFSSVAKQLDSVIPKIMIGLSGINMVINLIWVLVLGRDYSDLLLFTHIILGIGVVFIVYMTVEAFRKSKKIEKNMKVILFGFSILILSGILDVIRYYMFKASDSSLFTRMGLMYFVILFTFYELSLFLNIIKKSAQTELMETLAYNDGLTGLLNRLAFNRDSMDIAGRDSGRYLLIQLDINYLKLVNDSYGHSEGDRFIIVAADLINNTFGLYGKCYRIGGDEFFVILEGNRCDEDYDNAVKLFEERINEINGRNEFKIPLCIAYGKSVFVPGTNSFDEAEREADNLMYERKKILKTGDNPV